MRRYIPGVIFYLSWMSVLGQGSLRQFEIKPVEVPSKENVVQADSRYPEGALIFIYSSIPDLLFKGSLEDIYKQRYLAEAGYYTLLVPPSRQLLVVMKPGFIEKTVRIDPSPKAVLGFEVSEQVATEYLPGWAELRIRVTPEDAVVTLNNKKLRMSGGEMNFRGKDGGLPPGSYSLTVEKENFRSVFRRVELSEGDQKRLDINLEPFVGKLSVRSMPSGADVTLDGQVIGKTPYDGNQMIGDYSLRLRLKDHLDDVRNITIGEDKTTTVSADLFNYVRAMRPAIRARKVSIAVGITGITAGTYFMFSGISNLSKYNSATTNAADYRKKVVRSTAIWPVSMLVGGVGIGGALYFHRKVLRQKSEYQLSFVPVPGGAEVTLSLPLGRK